VITPPDVPPPSEVIEPSTHEPEPEPTRFPEPDIQPAPEPQVAVDLYELTIRVKAYNLTLKDLTNTLHGEEIWTAKRLSESLEELDQLSQRREQLTLYRDVISTAEQTQSGQLETLDGAIALLGAKIFAAREHYTQEGAEAPQQELAQLNDLSHKLAQLAANRAQ
jgi:hypothetical protein